MFLSFDLERYMTGFGNFAAEGYFMPYKDFETFEEVSSALDYNPDTGVFTWKRDVAKNIKAGTEAGCTKATRFGKGGESTSYRYIRLNGKEVPAARIAWLLSRGEWPVGKIYFVDKNPSNLRADNMRMSNSLSEKYDFSTDGERARYMKDHQSAFPRDWKSGHLVRKFGITLEQYEAMHEAQGGLCAICKKPETETRLGKVKLLSVDHNHTTGAVRELLCGACNKSVGMMKEDITALRSMISYLEKHAISANDGTKESS